jgi:hypothetical protein
LNALRAGRTGSRCGKRLLNLLVVTGLFGVSANAQLLHGYDVETPDINHDTETVTRGALISLQ